MSEYEGKHNSESVTIHPDEVKITTGRADGGWTLHLVGGEYEERAAMDAVSLAHGYTVEVVIRVKGVKEE